MIVLETSTLIDLFRGVDRTRVFISEDPATTVITYHEIFTGVKHKGAKKEEKFFRRFFSEIEVLDLDLMAAEKSSEIMTKLLKLGIPVNSMDVLIARIAVANGTERLVSRDQDFINIAKVSELEVLVY
ncbi:MAG: type II toxin-antitoxin system VapC family toxin [Methanotrichaceae archaeon]